MRPTGTFLFLPFFVGLAGCSFLRAQPTAEAAAVSGPQIGQPGGQPVPLRTPYSQTIRFEHLGVGEGLSQSVVNAILQDQRGFLWLGTEDGLNRYDGYDMQVFRPEPDDPGSLSDRWITALAEDAQGYLWIGTRRGGLNRYDPGTATFRHYRNDPADPDSLGDDSIRALYADEDLLWIATSNGLEVLELASEIFQHFRSDPAGGEGISPGCVRGDDRHTLAETGGLECFGVQDVVEADAAFDEKPLVIA